MAEKIRSISGGDSGDIVSDVVTGAHHHYLDMYATNVGNSNGGCSIVDNIMNLSQISSAPPVDASSLHGLKTNLNISHNIGGSYCRFPKLEECAHFHYDCVQLGQILLRLVEDKSDLQSSSNASQHDVGMAGSQTHMAGGSVAASSSNAYWFIIKVSAEKSDPYLIRRSLENLKMLDEMLHRCVYDRKISGLRDFAELEVSAGELQLESVVSAYLNRFSSIVSDSLTCGPVLTWFQLDNKGRRLPLADMDTMKSINTPAVGAAYGIRRYTAQAVDEISIDVGDMISVIDMPSPAESTWWRGKKSHLQKSHYEVGFFPQTCVATIGDKVPRHLILPAPLVGSLAVSPTKPVLRKHGKLIAFFRSFILSRPSRRRLKQSGIYKERVFSCDLSEHLLNSGQDIPMVLKCCAEFIEEFGIVDGIYRLSGITSNIQKLRRSFDEERIPDFSQPEIRQDIHALSSLLKMYFRELPNPLCTYQLYDHFVDAIQTRGDGTERLRLMKQTVQKLPPPHYRTLKYLATHLNKISHHSPNTGMTDRNLAIVWAPNLLRSPALESGGVAALRGVGVQAVVTEYLITNCGLIFDADDDFDRCYESLQYDSSLTDTESLQIEQRDHHDHSLYIERPKSLSVGGPKLISLEEAQTRHNRLEFVDVSKSHPINTPGGCSSYIEVGGGPSSLPDKYHTVLPVPRSWQKRKTHSWKSLFTRNNAPPPRNSNSNQDMKRFNAATAAAKKSVLSISRPCREEDAVTHISLRNGQDAIMAKSTDLFDGKPMDICVRSGSVDSLRTAGHSRSVSHDSYFDLLQSPLRAGAATCGSRELSELGMNFDREEPEMRIFSESESLVSSPRVAKDAVRRATRNRPEDSPHVTAVTSAITGGSVNPSPKKQPRLNLQQCSSGYSASTNELQNHYNNDESMCKRYKLEDQLSDIQYIDCSTPEHHTLNNPNTIYASVQIHNPPASSQNSSITTVNESSDPIAGDTMTNAAAANPSTGSNSSRYSYPGTKFRHSEPEKRYNNKDEQRFSYPGMGKKFIDETTNKYICRVPIDGVNTVTHPSEELMTRSHSSRNQKLPGILRRSSSSEMSKLTDVDHRSKLSIATTTPTTPARSPRYSLLVGGDTTGSSGNSSLLSTPVYEMDMSCTGSMLPMLPVDQQEHSKESRMLLPYETKEYAAEQVMAENSCSTSDKRDIGQIKVEMSLDLGGSKMSVDGDASQSSSHNNRHIINIPSTPNTPNYTHTSGNTSQSMTPSEFGYTHLNRQSGAVSLESSPKAIADRSGYANLEECFSNYDKAIGGGGSGVRTLLTTTAKAASPIRSTINITYNLKSPRTTPTHENVFFANNVDKHSPGVVSSDYELVNVVTVSPNAVLIDVVPKQQQQQQQKKPLLETSFDENMVYEQVKCYKGAISEVNSLMVGGNNGNGATTSSNMVRGIESPQQVVPPHDAIAIESHAAAKQQQHNYANVSDTVEINSNSVMAIENGTLFLDGQCEDVPMYDNELDIQDSLEVDASHSLYENVELRRPDCVYENVDVAQKPTVALPLREHKPKNFTVRQLANKFETSPVDTPPPFDFSKPFGGRSVGSVRQLDNNRNSPCAIKAKNSKQLHKSAKITRSLDENAFIREFGGSQHTNGSGVINAKLDTIMNKSSQQISEIDGRRMSLEFTRPKSLNPPKRLPHLQDAGEPEICKVDSSQKLTLDLTPTLEPSKHASSPKYDIKITPTTENPISLIQHNVEVTADEQPVLATTTLDDDKASLSSIKGLGNCKLDRDRIEKIKEERRHQLNEKFRSESFRATPGTTDPHDYNREKVKSKSKIELRDLKDSVMDTGGHILHHHHKAESLRFKSKSRGDIRSTDPRPTKDELLDRHVVVVAASAAAATTLSGLISGGRVRRISDEKNQNDCLVDYITDVDAKLADLVTTSTRGRKKDFDGRDRDNISAVTTSTATRNSLNSQRERISPQFSIRDVAAMFESRAQNQ